MPFASHLTSDSSEQAVSRLRRNRLVLELYIGGLNQRLIKRTKFWGSGRINVTDRSAVLNIPSYSFETNILIRQRLYMNIYDKSRITIIDRKFALMCDLLHVAVCKIHCSADCAYRLDNKHLWIK